MGSSGRQSATLPKVFNVLSYGAKGDGSTDDTAAINSAIADAVTKGVADGTNYGEVYFPPATYVLSSATTKTVSNKGNAQIWLPLITTTVQKFVLVLRGTRSNTALPHWQQTNVQRAGSTLKCTLTGLTSDATWGAPSVVGGPTPAQGYGQGVGLFNNMHIVVDGIGIVVPSNPTIMAFDFSGMAQATVVSASANASTVPGTAEPTLCTNNWAIGVYMPQSRNNDLCEIYDMSVEGMYFGLILSEHSHVHSARIIYCNTGVDCLDGGDMISCEYMSIEQCRTAINFESTGGNTQSNVNFKVIDIEQEAAGNFAHVNDINDPNNMARGYIGMHTEASNGTSNTLPVVNGGTGVRIMDLPSVSGTTTAPTVPASTTALVNPKFRDAAVTVSGGTVSAIAVDGVATGITSGTVIVPSGRSITLTYTVAPTWKWTLL